MSQIHALFCVILLLLIRWLPIATAGPFELPKILQKLNPDDPDAKHDKRSLNGRPYDAKYLSTEKYTLEIMPDGSVQASDRARPEYGKIRCAELTYVRRHRRLIGVYTRVQRPANQSQKNKLSKNRQNCVNGFALCTRIYTAQIDVTLCDVRYVDVGCTLP